MAVDEALDDLRVERRPARGDPLHRIHELRHVPHAFLEQVADAGRGVADELEHVERLEVLRQHEHGESGYERLISAAATSPSSALPGGMRTSTIAMSGEYDRTFSSRSSASPERPTTSCPASCSSDAMPSRSSALSSAMTIRSGCLSFTSPRSGVAVEGVKWIWPSAADGARFADTLELQRVEHAVARILAQTDRPVDVYAAALEAIGSSLGWELGAVWEVGPGRRAAALPSHLARGRRRPGVRGAERADLARAGRGAAGPGLVVGRAGLADRRAGGRRTSRAPTRRPPRRACMPPSASRCSARAASSA